MGDATRRLLSPALGQPGSPLAASQERSWLKKKDLLLRAQVSAMREVPYLPRGPSASQPFSAVGLDSPHGDGDQRHLPPEDGEGGGGRGHPWNEGPGGHHRGWGAEQLGSATTPPFPWPLAQSSGQPQCCRPVFQAKDVPEKSCSPEESIRMTKGITMATAKAVAAGNSCRQEDVIATANLSRKAVAEMLAACKQASYHPDVSEDVRMRALHYGTECTLAYLQLLEHVLMARSREGRFYREEGGDAKEATFANPSPPAPCPQILQKPSAELKHLLAALSKGVAGAVTELIQSAEAMKGTEWVNPEDPTVIAETELLGAAASIEAAAKKLEQLKPRAKPKQADETLDFEEQILEAAKSIAAATSALVKSASAAQRELVAQGKVGAIPANAADDGQWSQGLVSAEKKDLAPATGEIKSVLSHILKCWSIYYPL
ncbi:Talin-2, partial [Ophiophagus hannah]